MVALFFIQGCAGGGSGVRVVTEKTRLGTPSADYVTGKTEAADSVTIIPKISGRVAEVLVDVGSRVQEGQVLLKMEMADLEGVRNQSLNAVQDAEAALEKAAIDLNTAKDNYERAQNLYHSGALSKADFDNKYAAPYELAKIQAEKTAPSKLAQARAALQTAEANYANAVIKSPLSGEVTARYINPGETCATAKPSPVFVVADLSGMTVTAYVDESKLNTLKVGQKVAVMLDSVEGAMEAEVKNISYALDAGTKGYQVKFSILKPSESIKPGMFARVYLDGSLLKQFVVPRKALVEESGAYAVFVYNEGKVKKVAVKVDKISDSYAVITDGLDEGQELVVYGSAPLEDGMGVGRR
jgi:RND family efflux transporter MFP subunit